MKIKTILPVFLAIGGSLAVPSRMQAQPTFDVQPLPGPFNCYSNASLVLTVNAIGTGTVTYQWQLDGSNVTGATSPSISIASLGLNDLANRQFWKGSYSASDPKIRRLALDYSRQMCEVAGQLDCETLNIWPGQDGYDYLLCSDYEKAREWFCEAIATLAWEFPGLRFALEYKPKEPRTHSYLARMADTLLLAQETGCSNVGVTIDTGHAFVAGENVGEVIVLARRAGDRLFHMHFNDNHTTSDDDMIAGTIHSVCYIEMLYWLDRCGYKGWLSMDQYPYREDAAEAIGESILWLRQFDRVVREHRRQIDKLVMANDAVATSRFLRTVLAGSPSQQPPAKPKV